MVARYRNTIAGLIPGCVSLFLSFHLRSFFAIDPNFVMRALKTLGFALVVPGLIVAILAGNSRSFSLPLMAAVDFVFWFGFGWLLATFITKLIELRRVIRASGSLNGSLSGRRSDGPSSRGSE